MPLLDNKLRESLEAAYTAGFKDAVITYSTWSSGTQRVGSRGTPLREVLADLDRLRSFTPQTVAQELMAP